MPHPVARDILFLPPHATNKTAVKATIIVSFKKLIKLNPEADNKNSYEEILERISSYQESSNRKVIMGSGWDQSLWAGEGELPNNSLLSKRFPNIPICLYKPPISISKTSLLKLIAF